MASNENLSPTNRHSDFSPHEVLSKLTLKEKISLVSGSDFWHLAGLPRFGIPAVRTSDGPNGVRGTKLWNGVPAACFPCGTALGSTWDKDLIYQGGKLMGEEAIAKGVALLLGPTVNIQRSPLGGRGFESYSEDPVLSGEIAAACVNGIQSTGVAATIKHLVCNDLEDKRMLSDSIVTSRALREIYLKPFQIVQEQASPKAYMTSYNRLNGKHCSEDPKLLQDIIRKEWGFDGLVVSDWFGTYSCTEALKAGLDLEMPGPSYKRGTQIEQDLWSGKLLMHELDTRVLEVLKFIKSTLPLNLQERSPELTIDTPDTAALLKRIACDSIVLLRNQGDILPFSRNKTTAVIGPNAAFAAYCGGGSASLLPYHAISPLDAIKQKVSNVEYTLGVPGWKRLPLASNFLRTRSGRAGIDMTVYLEPPSHHHRTVVDYIESSSSLISLFDYTNDKIQGKVFYCAFDGLFTPEETAEYELSCSVAGTARVFIDGQLVVDNHTDQTAGDSFFGSGTGEVIGSIKLEKGKIYKYHTEYGTEATANYARNDGVPSFGYGGCRLGLYRKVDLKEDLRKAVALAKNVDQVIMCIGLNGEWESEGFDRKHMDLPYGTDRLVREVIAANPNTVVVNQSGTPVTMSWAHEVPALMQAWYGGNETGHAIADAVFGDITPGGKLSLSFPWKNSDNPAYLNYTSDNNRTLYGEDIYVGYRFYEKMEKDLAFPFGFGLSYAEMEITQLDIAEAGESIQISVIVTNKSQINASEVVQVYFGAKEPSTNRPVKELKGFAKVHLKAGESSKAMITVSRRHATGVWSELRNQWVCEKGWYTISVGNSSNCTPLKAEYELSDTFYWRGL